MTLEAALFTPLILIVTLLIVWGMVNLALFVADAWVPDRPKDDWKGEGTPRW